MVKRGANIELLDDVIRMLAAGEILPAEYNDHILSGQYAGFHECHIRPDWLLVYDIDDNVLILTLFRTGPHSDLFQS